MTDRLHPDLEAEIRRLARGGVPAAEVRRQIVHVASKRGLSRPSYTAVRLLVHEEQQAPERWEPRASPLDSLAVGRMPTPYELEAVRERRLRKRLVN